MRTIRNRSTSAGSARSTTQPNTAGSARPDAVPIAPLATIRSVAGERTGKQHVEEHRKIALRKRLLIHAQAGAVYVPFIGDGDIAVELYTKRRIFGADLDPERCAVAASRLPLNATVVAADCNAWPFKRGAAGVDFAVADFDAYNNPWPSFESFWNGAGVTDRLVCFFTDGSVNQVSRSGNYMGRHWEKADRRRIFNFYALQHAKPRIAKTVSPWRVTMFQFYRRRGMYYFGAVIEAP